MAITVQTFDGNPFGDPLKMEEIEVEALSEDEVRQKLIDCIVLLRERERDLTTAAEVGQHLLQAHAAMKEAYDNFVASQGSGSNSNLSRSNSMPGILSTLSSSEIMPLGEMTHNLRSKQNSHAVASSIDNIYASTPAIGLTNKRRRQQEAWKTSLDYLSGPSIIRSVEYLAGLKNQLSTTKGNTADSWAAMNKIKENASLGSVGPDMSDYVSSLEKINLELENKITELTAQLRETAQARTKETERYARHIEETRSELTRVTEQAEELEKEKRRLLREVRENRKEKVSVEQEDQEVIDKLHKRLQETEEQNEKLLLEKQAVDEQLELALQDLDQLQTQLESYEAGMQDEQARRELYEHQETLIKELQEQLEEARTNYLTNVASFEAQLKGADSTAKLDVSLHDLLSGADNEQFGSIPELSNRQYPISPKKYSRPAPPRPTISLIPTSDPDQQLEDDNLFDSARNSFESLVTDSDEGRIQRRRNSGAPPHGGSILFALVWGFIKTAWKNDDAYEQQALWNAAVGDGILGCI
ncbi:hypothetical protein DFJ77DRAFT_11812 [Powellomyces hirtus]|nr:hypothetical protein DFJ77DRAFT_11812 [Powellomyces hirtus]